MDNAGLKNEHKLYTVPIFRYDRKNADRVDHIAGQEAFPCSSNTKLLLYTPSEQRDCLLRLRIEASKDSYKYEHQIQKDK